MCGILFCLEEAAQAPDANSWSQVFADLQEANTARGPDAQDTVCKSFDAYKLTFFGAELRLRGDGYIAQPHRDLQGNVLCWNGEVLPEENDGTELFSALQQTRSPEEIRDVLSSVEGPLILTSVSVGSRPEYSLDELSTQEFFFIDLAALATHNARLPPVNRTIPIDPPQFADLDSPPEHLSAAADELIGHLGDSPYYSAVELIVPCWRSSRTGTHVDPAEPIDLLNVAFENPRKLRFKDGGNENNIPRREKQKQKDTIAFSSIDANYDVPDRLTGLQELEELRRLSPNRTWNFVEINVPYDEYQAARSTIENMMFPCRTVMDLSLAAALYFAARGTGQVRDSATADPRLYQSPAKVLLNGLGSDELLGGYGRFHTRFKGAGWQAIIDELQLEIDRIPTRNLGRDDRIISCHGKETRHPFLSLSLVAYLSQLPVHTKLDPRMEAGVGEKVLLRVVARKLGLLEASIRKKRAMQFGSHSARMTPGDEYRKGDLLLGSSKE
ncbi:hypothetical protein PHLGIDRAFT_21688 [Phlebiopsis gigantea 11061_1 CR5-6]|uniref:Asparagine synthetase domain-containing protein n=1 Tax=Phlebiopsis gigantea (strain 11061_1 CR5-6) TaxID=745531 RepID=A0A0C3P130_PHLG1|nr:hypothetical protein PHLGIDRAFT_21688 [Phlebiopsis gigantea 11061_1 CR5-6]